MDNRIPLVVETAPESGSRPQTFWQHLTAAWLRFSGPNPRLFSESLEDQERLRRARVLSGFLLLMLIAMLIVIPTAIASETYWSAILIFAAFGFVAFFCNRAARINLGGLFVILAVDVSVILLLVTLPNGIRNSNIPDLDLFLIAVLISGIVLPRQFVPVLVLVHICLIVLLYIFLPHDVLLKEEIRRYQGGSAYNELSDALLLQVVGGAIAWLNARSFDLALLRASKAEELAATQKSLHEQVVLQGEQMMRLEYGIEVLKEAHARFANGDYRARAVLQDNELASLAISFNLLADRVNRIAREAREREKLELAFQQLFAIQEEVVYSGQLRPFVPTGTLVDKIYPWLKQYFLFRQVYKQCETMLEKMRVSLTRQRALLAQLQTLLEQIRVELRHTRMDTQRLDPSFELIERARGFCEQAEEQGHVVLQETRQWDRLLRM